MIRKSKKEKNNQKSESKIRRIFVFDEEEDNSSKSTFSLLEVILIIFVSIFFGFVIGYIITYSKMDIKVKEDSNVGEIVDAYKMIRDNYYGEFDIEKLKESAINGMLKSLDDPYSIYMNKESTSNFNDLTNGYFIGIGISVLYEEEYNRVVEVTKDYPADKVGVQVDDIIVKVDGVDCKGVYGQELSDLIRGEAGTKFTLTVLRDEKEIDFEITRGKIDIDSVSGEVLESNIGYLKVSNIASNTYDQFKEELEKLEEEKIQSLIIDVRNNPGGQIQQTREILSLFFKKKTVLFQIEAKNKKEKIKSLNNTSRDYPIIVLINHGSASAAEIIASCFQDNYSKAKIVGVTSYGKGTVQKNLSLSSGNSYKFTTQKWLTSKGKWVHEKGVEPDISVEQEEEYYENPTKETDAVLKKAIELLKES